MNREIKFELKIKRKGYMDSYFEHLTLEQLINRNGLLFSDIWEVEYKRQFTGLQDKNGVDIYEGDIVAISTSPYKNIKSNYTVIWDESMFGFHLISSNGDGDEYGVYTRNIRNNDEREVIGNIYQNADILTTEA